MSKLDQTRTRGRKARFNPNSGFKRHVRFALQRSFANRMLWNISSCVTLHERSRLLAGTREWDLNAVVEVRNNLQEILRLDFSEITYHDFA
jgi:hypothetical protein